MVKHQPQPGNSINNTTFQNQCPTKQGTAAQHSDKTRNGSDKTAQRLLIIERFVGNVSTLGGDGRKIQQNSKYKEQTSSFQI